MSDQSEEKTDDASERKLRKLREKGLLPSAPTGSDFAGLGAGMLAAAAILPLLIDRLRESFDAAFANLSQGATESGFEALRFFALTVNLPLAAIVAAVAAGGVAFKILSQGGFVFAMEQVTPKLSHVDPAAGLGRLFKGQALAGFAAAALRLTILVAVMGALAWVWAPSLLRLDLCAPACVWPVMWAILRLMLTAVAVLLILSILADVGMQRAFFLIDQRMTKTEVKQERKDTMGQPEIRQERRRRSRELLEGAQVLGRSRAAIYFHDGDDVVAFAFHPTRIPLPKIASRARGAAGATLRAELDALGVPGRRSRRVVKVSIGQEPGSAAKREIFADLARALRDVMG